MTFNFKYIFKKTAIVTAVLTLITTLLLLIYYLLFFRNTSDISTFAPADAEMFVSAGSLSDTADILNNLVSPEVRKKLMGSSGGTAEESSVLMDRILFALGKEAAVIKRGDEYGLITRISFGFKLATAVPGLLSAFEADKIEIKGNNVYSIKQDKKTIYFLCRWDILSVATGKDLAGDLAELLNKRPVVRPISNDPLFLALTGENINRIYIKNRFAIPETPLWGNLKGLKNAGGTFSIAPDSIKSSLTLKGTFPPFKAAGYPENPSALTTASFPIDLKSFWNTYSNKIQARKNKNNSLQLTLTSGLFDRVFDMFEKNVFIYSFLNKKTPSPYPSAVFCLRGQHAFSEKTLKMLWTEFALNARNTNEERVTKHGAKKLEIKNLKKASGELTVYYLTIKPSFIPNFTPGFCVVDDTLLIGTEVDAIIQTAFQVKSPLKPIPHRYFFHSRDKGLKETVAFLQKFLSKPSKIQEMGEAEHSRIMNALEEFGMFFEPVTELRISDGGKTALNKINIEVKLRETAKAEDKK